VCVCVCVCVIWDYTYTIYYVQWSGLRSMTVVFEEGRTFVPLPQTLPPGQWSLGQSPLGHPLRRRSAPPAELLLRSKYMTMSVTALCICVALILNIISCRLSELIFAFIFVLSRA